MGRGLEAGWRWGGASMVTLSPKSEPREPGGTWTPGVGLAGVLLVQGEPVESEGT